MYHDINIKHFLLTFLLIFWGEKAQHTTQVFTNGSSFDNRSTCACVANSRPLVTSNPAYDPTWPPQAITSGSCEVSLAWQGRRKERGCCEENYCLPHAVHLKIFFAFFPPSQTFSCWTVFLYFLRKCLEENKTVPNV